MKRKEPALFDEIGGVIVRFFDAVADSILYFTWHRRMLRERDPQKRLEKELLFEISGIQYGGMAGHEAWKSFKKNYYDNLPTEASKENVRAALLRMLRFGSYSIPQKLTIAGVCSELNMKEAALDISLVQEAGARNMSMRQLRRFKREQTKRELKAVTPSPYQ